jgi:hypothetical protein
MWVLLRSLLINIKIIFKLKRPLITITLVLKAYIYIFLSHKHNNSININNEFYILK